MSFTYMIKIKMQVPVPRKITGFQQTILPFMPQVWICLGTGCPGSKFPNSNSFYSEIMEVRPQVGKAKMCLRNIHFCLHLELFVYKKFKNMKYEHLFQHCFHGQVDQIVDRYAKGLGFESHSGIIKKLYFCQKLLFFFFFLIFQKLNSTSKNVYLSNTFWL